MLEVRTADSVGTFEPDYIALPANRRAACDVVRRSTFALASDANGSVSLAGHRLALQAPKKLSLRRDCA